MKTINLPLKGSSTIEFTLEATGTVEGELTAHLHIFKALNDKYDVIVPLKEVDGNWTGELDCIKGWKVDDKFEGQIMAFIDHYVFDLDKVKLSIVAEKHEKPAVVEVKKEEKKEPVVETPTPAILPTVPLEEENVQLPADPPKDVPNLPSKPGSLQDRIGKKKARDAKAAKNALSVSQILTNAIIASD